MDGFKPLMELNGFPMIQMTVQSLRNGGVGDITVVVGRLADEMRRVLLPLGVTVVENADYGVTDMFASVRMGLSHIVERGEPEAVFFLPGDIPLVSPKTLEALKRRALGAAAGTQVLLPLVDGRTAHPPVFLGDGVFAVLGYYGEGGLRGAFSSMATELVELSEDQGALVDADFREDFERLGAYAKAHKGVSVKVCERLYEEALLPAPVRRHCLAVGNLAGWMAERLVEKGACLDVELCRSGGFLHDICRLSPDHERAGGRLLKEMGFEALARIVEGHRGFGAEPESVCEEGVLVCLADKMILEERRVSLRERYGRALGKCLEESSVKERIRRDFGICQRLLNEFEVMTGERL